MSVTYIGEQRFIAQSLPVPGKNDFGMDTLTLRMRGPATDLDRYIKTLRQGATIDGYSGFYLQTWNTDEDPVYPTVSLNYKGLLNGVPDPLCSTDTTTQSITVNYTAPSGSYGITLNDEKVTKSATRTITFTAFGAQFRYIENKRPQTHKYSKPPVQTAPVITISTISAQTTDGETVIFSSSSAPAALLTALTPALVSINTGHSASPVVGSPYFECVDNCTYTYLAT